MNFAQLYLILDLQTLCFDFTNSESLRKKKNPKIARLGAKKFKKTLIKEKNIA